VLQSSERKADQSLTGNVNLLRCSRGVGFDLNPRVEIRDRRNDFRDERYLHAFVLVLSNIQALLIQVVVESEIRAIGSF